MNQPDTTEDVKLANGFTTLQNVINGNLDTNNLNASAGVKDTQLASPNNAARRLLATQYFSITSGTPYTSGAYCWTQSGGGTLVQSGVNGGSAAPLLWTEDASLAVAGKTTTGVIRLNTITNIVSPSVTLTAGLTQITGDTGGGGALTISFSAPALATASITPAAGNFQTADSTPFTLPSGSAHGWMLVLALTGTSPTTTNSFIGAYVNLYAYNV